MPLPLISQFDLDEIYLLKAKSVEKATELMAFAETQNEKQMTRLASSDRLSQTDLVGLFVQMLKCLNMSSNENMNGVVSNLLANTNSEIKSAKSAFPSSRNDEIKMASKEIKDSHYQVDISKDTVVRKGGFTTQKVHMVSCYMRDAYLGRYVIKRNYFYTDAREASANEAYDEILTKFNALKDRYYNGIALISEITPQAQIILEGVISEIKMEEDSLGTTVNRHYYDNPSH